MKKFNFTLAALALIAAGCSNQDFTEAVQENRENNPRTITLQTSMPEITDDTPATRTTYESDGAEISGIVMKWEATDKLKLCFKHGDACYHKDADIVPGSISADGKRAAFALTLPDEIGDEDIFDFYAVYQRKYPNNNGSGLFQMATTNFELVADEHENITLDQTGESRKGIINPMLLFSHTNTTKAKLGVLKLNFAHTGWIMALHLKNNSGKEMELPGSIRLLYSDESTTSFIWNGYHTTTTKVKMDVATGAITADAPNWESKASAIFRINEGNWNPLYSGKLAAGGTIVLYRWLVSTDNVEPMGAYMQRKNVEDEDYTFNNLPAKSVTKGKVYHVFLNWNGSTLTITNRAGNPF